MKKFFKNIILTTLLCVITNTLALQTKPTGQRLIEEVTAYKSNPSNDTAQRVVVLYDLIMSQPLTQTQRNYINNALGGLNLNALRAEAAAATAPAPTPVPTPAAEPEPVIPPAPPAPPVVMPEARPTRPIRPAPLPIPAAPPVPPVYTPAPAVFPTRTPAPTLTQDQQNNVSAIERQCNDFEQFLNNTHRSLPTDPLEALTSHQTFIQQQAIAAVNAGLRLLNSYPDFDEKSALLNRLQKLQEAFDIMLREIDFERAVRDELKLINESRNAEMLAAAQKIQRKWRDSRVIEQAKNELKFIIVDHLTKAIDNILDMTKTIDGMLNQSTISRADEDTIKQFGIRHKENKEKRELFINAAKKIQDLGLKTQVEQLIQTLIDESDYLDRILINAKTYADLQYAPKVTDAKTIKHELEKQLHEIEKLQTAPKHKAELRKILDKEIRKANEFIFGGEIDSMANQLDNEPLKNSFKAAAERIIKGEVTGQDPEKALNDLLSDYKNEQKKGEEHSANVFRKAIDKLRTDMAKYVQEVKKYTHKTSFSDGDLKAIKELKAKVNTAEKDVMLPEIERANAFKDADIKRELTLASKNLVKEYEELKDSINTTEQVYDLIQKTEPYHQEAQKLVTQADYAILRKDENAATKALADIESFLRGPQSQTLSNQRTAVNSKDLTDNLRSVLNNALAKADTAVEKLEKAREALETPIPPTAPIDEMEDIKGRVNNVDKETTRIKAAIEKYDKSPTQKEAEKTTLANAIQANLKELDKIKTLAQKVQIAANIDSVAKLIDRIESRIATLNPALSRVGKPAPEISGSVLPSQITQRPKPGIGQLQGLTPQEALVPQDNKEFSAYISRNFSNLLNDNGELEPEYKEQAKRLVTLLKERVGTVQDQIMKDALQGKIQKIEQAIRYA